MAPGGCPRCTPSARRLPPRAVCRRCQRAGGERVGRPFDPDGHGDRPRSGGLADSLLPRARAAGHPPTTSMTLRFLSRAIAPGLALLGSVLPAQETKPVFRPAYPPSPVIGGLAYDDRAARIEAPGSDIWPLTWADDDNLYTAWGDGGGFGGNNEAGRVSLGIGVIRGTRDNYRGFNLAGGVDAPHPEPFPGKSEGILAIGPTLYLWRDGDGSSPGYFKFIELYRSDDKGVTWKKTKVRFAKGEGDFPERDAGIF